MANKFVIRSSKLQCQLSCCTAISKRGLVIVLLLKSHKLYFNGALDFSWKIYCALESYDRTFVKLNSESKCVCNNKKKKKRMCGGYFRFYTCYACLYRLDTWLLFSYRYHFSCPYEVTTCAISRFRLWCEDRMSFCVTITPTETEDLYYRMSKTRKSPSGFSEKLRPPFPRLKHAGRLEHSRSMKIRRVCKNLS